MIYNIYGVFDTKYIYSNSPFMFQDMDKGIQTWAIYSTEQEAKEAANLLNSATKSKKYVVKKISKFDKITGKTVLSR